MANPLPIFGYATAAPTDTREYHQAGEFIFNSAPTIGSSIQGWVCTTSGYPGTWAASFDGLVRVNINIPAGATAADYDGLHFCADAAYQLVSVKERHATAGNDAGAVTLQVAKVPSGTAKASGTSMLASGISLKGTADTTATGTLSATAANTVIAAGDWIGLVLTGTPTAVDGVSVSLVLRRTS